MADAFSFKRTARLPIRVITLAGNGLSNLDGIDPGSVKFVYRQAGVEERKEIAGTVQDSAAMKVAIPFGAIDVATEGKYQWQIEVTVGGLTMCFPEKGFYTFAVTDNIEA